MPIELQWDDESHTILCLNFAGAWDWDNYYDAMQQSEHKLSLVDHRVDIILDFSDSGKIPGGAFQHFKQAALNVPPNRGLIVMVGVTAFLRAIGGVMERTYPRTARSNRISGSIEEARRIIRQAREREQA